MLATYSAHSLVGFIMFLFKKNQEDELWQIWLNKDIDQSFNDFKAANIAKEFRPKAKVNSEQEEQEILDFSDQFIKPNN